MEQIVELKLMLNKIHFLDLRVKANEYHKVLITDSNTTSNFVKKLEFFIILKIILN